MKKFFAGLATTIGVLALALGFLSRFLPIDRIVAQMPWLSFIKWIENAEPYEMWLFIGGAVLLALGIAARIIINRKQSDEERAQIPALLSSEIHYRADNLDIKSRVRDLLKRAWGGPLVALILIAIPFVAVQFATHFFLMPFQRIYTATRGVFNQYGDMRANLVLIIGGAFPSFAGFGNALLPCLPGIAVLLAALIFLFNPLTVSRAGYFAQLLYGKRPSPLMSYKIGETYSRSLGGTLYRSIWVLVWLVVWIGVPIGLYVGGVTVINAYPEQLTALSFRILPILAGVSAGLFVIFLFRLINRCLAYAFVPSILATQKSLSARHAMRASRYLTRGRKFRLLGLWLSFSYYFIPTIAAAVILVLIRFFGATFAFTEYFTLSLKRFLYAVMALNQILLLYVAPIAHASFYAFYLEAKREFKESHQAIAYIIGAGSKPRQEAYEASQDEAAASAGARAARLRTNETPLSDGDGDAADYTVEDIEDKQEE